MKRVPGVTTMCVSSADGRALWNYVIDPGRKNPVIVVIDDSGLDADVIAQRARLCDVFSISARLANDVVPPTHGLLTLQRVRARVYPPGNTWQTDSRASRYFVKPEEAEQDVIDAGRDVTPGAKARAASNLTNAATRTLTAAARTGPTRLESPVEVGALVARLTDPERTNAIAVITVPFDKTEPVIDANAVWTATDGEVDVVVLGTRDATFALSDAVGRRSGVYGGAGRVYEPGTEWISDPYTSRLHFVEQPHHAAAATDRMIADALRAAHNCRLRAYNAAKRTAQPVAVAPAQPAAIDPLQHYRPGDVVLAQVRDVNAAEAVVELFPHVEAVLPAASITGNPLDRVDDLLSADEVVAVRIAARDGDTWGLSMLDIDDDEIAVPAPPVRDGGKPWIALSDNDSDELPAAPDTLFEAVPDTPAAPSALDRPSPTLMPGAAAPMETPRADTARVASLEAEIDQLRQALEVERADRAHYYAEVHKLKHDLQQTRARVRTTRTKERSEGTAPSIEFSTPEQQLRWLVLVAWASVVPAAEKSARPLPEYCIGGEFLDYFHELTPQARQKTIKTMVRVLLDERIDGQHPLYDGKQAPVVARNGAACLRAPIEKGTPSARRLHYWRGHHGIIEFAKVNVHDDMSPGPDPTFQPAALTHRF